MNPDKLSGLNRAAVLLMSLGEEAASRIFKELSDEEIHQIARSMATINHIPVSVKNAVLQQYHADQQKMAGLFIKGNEFARNSISATNSGEWTDSLLNQHVSETEAKPFAFISTMKAQLVADLLAKEHPQTIALILSTQDSDHSSNIISCLAEDLQAEIIHRIAKLDYVSVEVMTRLEEFLEQEVGKTNVEKQKLIGGFDRAVQLLSKMTHDRNDSILGQLEQTDTELAKKMRSKLFTFEGLVNLDNRVLQLLLREINNDSLTLALKTASESLKEKIFSNMSPRAVEMIRDDLEALGPVRLNEVEAMQQTIVTTAMKLEDNKALKGENGNSHVVF